MGQCILFTDRLGFSHAIPHDAFETLDCALDAFDGVRV